MTRLPLLVLLALPTLSCSGGSGDGGGGGGGIDGGGGGGDFAPASGAWDYSEFTPVSNTCNTSLIENQPSGGFTILDNGDGTFTVTPGDGTDPFDCALSGKDYVCASTGLLSQDINGALVTGVGSVSGSFASEISVSGTRVLDVTCAGAGCAALEGLGVTFPCQLQVSFTGALIAAP